MKRDDIRQEAEEREIEIEAEEIEIEEVEEIEVEENEKIKVEEKEVEDREEREDQGRPSSSSQGEKYPSFVFAGFFERFVAYLVDILMISLLSRIILRPAYQLLGISKTNLFFSIYNLGQVSLYLLYFFLLTGLNRGQTLGKMLLGLRVVSLYEEDLSWSTVFTREILGRFILRSLKILYLPIFFSPKKQQTVDFLSNTSVIKEDYLVDFLTRMDQEKTRKGSLNYDL